MYNFRYGNNFGSIGSLRGDKAGSYRLSYNDGTAGEYRGGPSDGFMSTLNSPTPYGLLLVRTAIYNVDTDYLAVYPFQNNITVTNSTRILTGPSIPPLNLTIFRDPKYNPDAGSVTIPVAVLELTAVLSRYNLPYVIQDRTWVAGLLSAAGIGNGTFVQPVGTNLSKAVESAEFSTSSTRTIAGFFQQLGNNWTQPSPTISGDFRSFYSVRHLIAMIGYLQVTADQALYPSYSSDGNSAREIDVRPDESVLFTFSRKPDLVNTGFWSLTVYGTDHFLIPNDLRRYALSSRSNLTYADGTPIKERDEGQFQILIQSPKYAPPNNWTTK
jgi:hypothetical protein